MNHIYVYTFGFSAIPSGAQSLPGSALSSHFWQKSGDHMWCQGLNWVSRTQANYPTYWTLFPVQYTEISLLFWWFQIGGKNKMSYQSACLLPFQTCVVDLNLDIFILVFKFFILFWFSYLEYETSCDLA